MSDFNVKQGNLLPVVAATLLNPDGTPFNLTGCTVAFNAQGPVGFTGAAVIVTAAAGTVTYTFAAGQTEVPGDYQAEWMVTKADSSVVRFPLALPDYLTFTILAPLPITPPTNVTLVRDCYEPIRAILGDFNTTFRRYDDSAVASVVRTVLRTGKLEGFTLTANLQGITPAIIAPRVFGTLVYHAAKMLLVPNVAEYQYRTRALGEKFGNQREFLRDLENSLFELENDTVFRTWNSFYSWLNSTTGINIWQNLAAMHVVAPVAEVTIGRNGITVSGS